MNEISVKVKKEVFDLDLHIVKEEYCVQEEEATIENFNCKSTKIDNDDVLLSLENSPTTETFMNRISPNVNHLKHSAKPCSTCQDLIFRLEYHMKTHSQIERNNFLLRIQRFLKENTESNTSADGRLDDYIMLPVDKFEEAFESNCKCKICNLSFFTEKELNSHKMIVHQLSGKIMGKIKIYRSHYKKSKSVLCVICATVFPDQRALWYHLTTHTKNYVCYYCQKGFMQKTVYIMHKTKCRLKPRKGNPCNRKYKNLKKSDTDVTDTSESNAILRIKPEKQEKTRQPSRPHKCLTCGKVCKTSSHYKEHLIVHSEDRPYECAHCPKKFKTKFVIKGHVMTHAKYRPIYPCDICDKTLLYPYDLKRHKKLHTRTVE